MLLNRELSGIGIAGLLTEFVAPSDYENALGEVTQFVDEGSTSAYLTTIQGVYTPSSVSRTWNPTRHNQKFMMGQIKIPTYEISAYYEVSKKDLAVLDKTLSVGNTGQGGLSLFDSCCNQALKQRVRILALYGSEAGEGILDNVGSFTFGNDGANTTMSTYSAKFVGNKLIAMGNRILNNLKGYTSKISFLMSQRIFNLIGTTPIESTSYLSTGSAVSILDYVKQNLEALGVEVVFGWDDTFEGAGTNGADYIFVNAPLLKNVEGEGVAKDVNRVVIDANTFKANSFIDIGSAGIYHEPNSIQNSVISGEWKGSVTCGVTTRKGSALLAEVTFQ